MAENRDKFRTWLQLLVKASWLLEGTGAARLAAVGGALDHDVERVRLAAKSALPLSCDAEALAYVGASRGLIRGPAEATSAYRDRVWKAWDAWDHAGSGFGILTQLRALGYTSTNGNPVIVQQNGWALRLDANGDLVIDLLGPNPAVGGTAPLAPGVTEWFSFDATHIDANSDQYNARFGLIFPTPPAGWITPTVPPVVAPTLAEVNTIRRIVNQWRAGEARFMWIVVCTSGDLWDWPLTYWDAAPEIWDVPPSVSVTWGPEET